MRHARLLVLFPAVVALGCPGEWDEPLGPVHGGRIDETLVAEWQCRATGRATQMELSIVPFDRHQYVLVALDTTDKDAAQKAYFRGHTSTLGVHEVMNLKVMDVKPGDWTYARFHAQDAQLTIDLVRSQALDGVADDVESRRQALEDLFASPDLWEDGYRCVRRSDETASEPSPSPIE